jgi:hypothetical protein
MGDADKRQKCLSAGQDTFSAAELISEPPNLNPAYRPAHHHACDLQKRLNLKMVWILSRQRQKPAASCADGWRWARRDHTGTT